MDVLALALTVAAMIMFVFAASGRELRRFNEIALGLVFLTAALICQFTSVTNTHIGRLRPRYTLSGTRGDASDTVPAREAWSRTCANRPARRSRCAPPTRPPASMTGRSAG
jgi:hypothetical protein